MSKDVTIRLWSTDKWNEALMLPGHSDYVHALAWSPEGRMFASGSGDTTVRD